METICNAQITRAYLGLFSPKLKDGLNFKLRLELQLATGSVCGVDLNPAKIPKLLELLGIRGFNDIEGQYIQVKYESNKIPDFIKPILAKPYDSWFELDNGIYFGSRIITEEELECLKKS